MVEQEKYFYPNDFKKIFFRNKIFKAKSLPIKEKRKMGTDKNDYIQSRHLRSIIDKNDDMIS